MSESLLMKIIKEATSRGIVVRFERMRIEQGDNCDVVSSGITVMLDGLRYPDFRYIADCDESEFTGQARKFLSEYLSDNGVDIKEAAHVCRQ